MKKELGIYVHIPFCKSKCYYCDFISFKGKEKEIESYINALKKEIINESKKGKDYLVTTIYIGGGTPSYIDSKYIVEILKTIKNNYLIQENAEITIEVNPGTVTKDKLDDYILCGINRLSIGLQSTNNFLLQQIGRIHTYEEFLFTYNMARQVGFENINVDLMLALPNQTEEMLEESLNKVISLKPEHISLYSLILEENTVLDNMIKNNVLELPQDEEERKMYWNTKKILEKNGYIHYEISNFAKKNKMSRHNYNCWLQKEYIGFGISAHSYLEKKRYSNTENLEQYINYYLNENEESKPSIVTIHENQTLQEEEKEYMMLGLRKLEGISISEFKNKFIQNPIYIFRKELNKLVNEELIEINVDQIKLSEKGLDFANLVWEEFT